MHLNTPFGEQARQVRIEVQRFIPDTALERRPGCRHGLDDLRIIWTWVRPSIDVRVEGRLTGDQAIGSNADQVSCNILLSKPILTTVILLGYTIFVMQTLVLCPRFLLHRVV